MAEQTLQPLAGEPADKVKFTAEEQQQIERIAKGFNVQDSQAVVMFGVGAQKEISNFSDTILREVRTRDSGYVGEILSDMVLKIKEVNVDNLPLGVDFISKIPILGSLFGAFHRFVARYEKLSVHIEKIIEELDKARMLLLKDISLMDNLYQKNLDFLRNLDLYIAAGEMKLKELKETILPEMRAAAEASDDPLEKQKFHDFSQMVNRFEKKIHDLKLSRMICIQTAPQVRLIQNNNQALVEKIQSSILNTIPLWKNQIVIAISLFRQKKALQLQQEVSKTTDELLQRNAELLKQSSIDIAKESERGIVTIETLKKVNTDLITTIEETLRIQEEGRHKRQEVEGELQRLEGELKDKLMAVKND